MNATNWRGRLLVPRIIMILFGLFLMLFALDVFEIDAPLGQQIIGFLISLIPGILALAVVAVGWRHPQWSGWAALALAVVFTVWFGTWRDVVAFAIVSLPLLLMGVLFLLWGAPGGRREHGDA